jgi:hypothetical protein
MLGAVGFATLPEALRGPWPHVDFPKRVTLGGRTFVRSDSWAAPLPHVVKQYREDVDRNSLHLYVRDDRTWEIDHIDAANPERGLVLEHVTKDVIQTWWGASLLTIGVVAIVAGASYVIAGSRPARR